MMVQKATIMLSQQEEQQEYSDHGPNAMIPRIDTEEHYTRVSTQMKKLKISSLRKTEIELEKKQKIMTPSNHINWKDNYIATQHDSTLYLQPQVERQRHYQKYKKKKVIPITKPSPKFNRFTTRPPLRNIRRQQSRTTKRRTKRSMPKGTIQKYDSTN